MIEHTEIKSFFELQKVFPTEESCIQELARTRWGKKPVCPHCGSSRKIYIISKGKLFKCADCRKPFSVRIGTIFEDSPIPLKKWFMALWLITAHKKGISSMQLSRDLDVTQKTAWFMLHRIRYAMAHGSFHKPLDGIVEADETYIGGKHSGKRGRGSENKTPVFGMLDRDDETIMTQPVEKVNKKTLQGLLKENVDKGSTIMTDEWRAYNGLDKHFKGHEKVDHSNEEYARGIVHVNNLENFWSLLKRGITGIYHHVSRTHLHRYCSEFQYRYNTRKIKDSQRFSFALCHLSGRLDYSTLTN